MSVTTALVLARGLGTRMRREQTADLTPEQQQAAASGAKALMPIGAHALVDYILSALADAGVTDAVLVVPPDHEAFRAHLDALGATRLSVSLAVQAEPRGTADAVLSGRAGVGGRPFVMINGDNYYPAAALRAALASGPHTLAGFGARSLVEGGNIPADRLPRFAFAWADRHGHLTRVVEKPEPAPLDDPHALVSMNLWTFGPAIFEACTRVQPSFVNNRHALADRIQASCPRYSDATVM